VLSFVTAYNFAKHLKTLKWKTPFQSIRDAWKTNPSVFKINPHYLIPGPHSSLACPVSWSVQTDHPRLFSAGLATRSGWPAGACPRAAQWPDPWAGPDTTGMSMPCWSVCFPTVLSSFRLVAPLWMQPSGHTHQG
jgi:hypothetical protein